MLTAKRLIPEIYLTRLPTGHTHEDIDALFGHLWTAYRLRPCLTLSEYRSVVEHCFAGKSKIESDIVDVYVVPDYESFLSPHNDPIQRWAKEDLTVHQFHFYAVDPDINSPLGYRFRYRDYCSDRVVELKQVNKMDAVTGIGQLTGIEAVTHHVKWFPDSFNELGIIGDGIFNLRRIPVTDPINGIPPENFDEKSIKMLWATRSAILNCKMMPASSPQRAEWLLWFDSKVPTLGPTCTSGLKYIENHPYHQPLNEFLSNTIIMKQLPVIILADIGNSVSNSSKVKFDWPEEIYSFATPHVSFPGWQAAVINPRLYKYQNDSAKTLVRVFQEGTLEYYKSIDTNFLVPQLQNILRRRLDAQGKHQALNGNKEALIQRISQGDFLKFANLYGGIRDRSKRDMLDAYWQPSQSTFTSKQQFDSAAATQKLVTALRDQFESIHEATFLKLLELFKLRDEMLSTSYTAMYASAGCEQQPSSSTPAKQYLPSIYFNPELGTTLFALESFPENIVNTLRSIINGQQAHRVFFPIRSMKSLVVISIPDKEVWYFNADSTAPKKEALQLGTEYFELFKAHVLLGLAHDDAAWKLVCHRHCIKWERCGDISIIALIGHIINDLPIFFEREQLIHFHKLIALSLIEGRLLF